MTADTPSKATERSALHVHRGTRAVQRMVEHAPSTGGLALWVHHQDVPDDAPLPRVHGARDRLRTPAPVHTDGHTVFYRADFDALPVPEQAGWVAHQVLHIALRHAQRYLELRERIGDADLQLYNVCADAIVNSALGHLGWLKLPPNALRLEQLLARSLGVQATAETALLEWDVERLYRAIDDRGPTISGGRRSQRDAKSSSSSGGDGKPSPQRRDGESSDERDDAERPSSGPRADGPRAAAARSLGAELACDLAPDDGTRGAPEDEAEHAREWAERVLRGHAGDGEHSMLRALIADLPRTHTPWEQVLRMQVAHALAQKPSLSWSRPSRSYIANQGRAGVHRRMPWEPGITASRAVPRLVVAVDVSGSIEKSLLDRFAREIEALSRRLEAALVLVIGDDQVRGVQTFEPGRSSLRDIVFHGGGGTDFTPLLEEAQRHRPDIVVVLTDLEGPCSFRPHCPVIWTVPKTHFAAVAPFGRLLVLD